MFWHSRKSAVRVWFFAMEVRRAPTTGPARSPFSVETNIQPNW